VNTLENVYVLIGVAVVLVFLPAHLRQRITIRKMNHQLNLITAALEKSHELHRQHINTFELASKHLDVIGNQVSDIEKAVFMRQPYR
jgi:hypothetical protein